MRKVIRKAASSGIPYEIPEDPWGTDWTAASIESMFIEIGTKSLYDQVYRGSSEWVHWSPRAILRAEQSAEWGVEGFTETNLPVATHALQLGCLSLQQSMSVLNQRFNLGRSTQLDELLKTMEKILVDSTAAAEELSAP